MLKCQVFINNEALTFAPFTLTGKIARKLIAALNQAYMQSLSISCAPYQPMTNTDRARYITACQMVHDNLHDVTEAQEVRNLCLERLRA